MRTDCRVRESMHRSTHCWCERVLTQDFWVFLELGSVRSELLKFLVQVRCGPKISIFAGASGSLAASTKFSIETDFEKRSDIWMFSEEFVILDLCSWNSWVRSLTGTNSHLIGTRTRRRVRWEQELEYFSSRTMAEECSKLYRSNFKKID